MGPNVLDLIADPVRLGIVRRLSGSGSANLAEIAEVAGVHANTIRNHIVDLEAAGLVEREPTAPERPGRPQVRYRLTPGWRLPSTDLHGLSELLAALVIRLDPAVESVHELGRQWGRFLTGRPGGDPLTALPRLLERLGFDAELAAGEVRLQGCPCPLVSPDHPELICRLVGGAIDGVAEVSPQPLRVASAAHDPVCRTCTIRLARRPAARPVPALALPAEA